MLSFTSEIRDFGGAGTCVMAIRHGNTTIKWSVGSDSSGFAGRYSSTFGLQTFTSRITGNAATRHIRQVSQMMVSQLRASRRQLSSPPLQEWTGSPLRGRVPAARGSSPHAGFTCQITRRTLPRSLKIIISHFPLRGKDIMRTRGAQRAWSLRLARRYSSPSRVGVPKQTPPDRPVILGQILSKWKLWIPACAA